MKRITPNPQKRGCALPHGCKDLIDVLQPKVKKSMAQLNPRQRRINCEIRARQVEIIQLKNGVGSLGVLHLGAALVLAQNQGVDLVEAYPDENPPLCILVDYGRYLSCANWWE